MFGTIPTKDVETRVVRAGSHDLSVIERGTGSPLLLLHGGGPGATGVSNYARNIAALAQRFRVIVPDLPGYGASSKTVDADDPFGSLAEAVRGLLDALELPSADLVGNSYGGAAALRLALEAPERVGRMVLMGPGGVGTTRALPTKGLNALLDYYGGDGPSRAKLERFIRDFLVHDASDIPDELIELRYQASLDPAVIANPPLKRPKGPNALRTLWRMDITRDPRLAGCAVPTLVVWGANDKVNRPAGGLALASTMANCTSLTLPQTGHWVQWERAEQFNRIVTEFLTHA